MSRIHTAVRYAEHHGKRDSLTIYLATLVGALAGELIRAEREIDVLRATPTVPAQTEPPVPERSLT